MHEPPGAGAGTESGLASGIAACAALVRGIRPPPLPSASSAAQTALTSRGRETGLSPRGREAACPTPESAAALLQGSPRWWGGMPRRGAGPCAWKLGGGAVLRNETMCNYIDNLPCRCVSMKDFFFFFGWFLYGDKGCVFLFIFSPHLCGASRPSWFRYLQRSCEAFSSACLRGKLRAAGSAYSVACVTSLRSSSHTPLPPSLCMFLCLC